MTAENPSAAASTAARSALRGRTVMITGAGGGLGRAFATALAREGARLVLVGRDPDSLARTAEEVRPTGASVLIAAGDVTRAADLAAAVAAAVSAFGSVDVLVNNAGQPGPIGPTWEVDPDHWWRAMEVHVKGTLLACRAVLPHMVGRGSGRVINIVSQAGVDRWPYVTAYAVSKAAVIKLTENLAAELRGHGVTVLSYHPGLVDTGITRAQMARPRDSDPWSDLVSGWFLEQDRQGAFTDIGRSASMLVRLARGDADAESGRYVTPDSRLGDGEGDGEGDGRAAT
ncbi:NADP-dependent 3-hydroxy acid dehydrogenase YdfG [Streptomyces sp. yr375]|uniref:SDR family NAD(P)-dependent oxidoreductase n=1 Tax=Streptomyces sp. yr375 TaxID=1761906 RepID=UPI0008C7058B|nr:SDR family oxidoreductase [Streptomyces sp. yr375]SES46720.1 NADP-dependent 3-hydroxy acid dehydrogenase YdfG [Streptomyces sp. yr375]